MRITTAIKLFLIYLLVLVFPLEAATTTYKKRIVVISTNSPSNPYWPQVFRVYEAAAKSLDFEFIHYDFGVKDRFAVMNGGIKIINQDPKPDAIFAVVAADNTLGILKAAEARNIPVFVIGPVFPEELASLGVHPRVKFKNWIGYTYQDEVRKGYQTAKFLLERAEAAKAYAKDGTIHVVGIGGRKSWFGSGLRNEGLEKAIAEYPKARLKEIVPSLWSPKEGIELSALLLERFPEARVVWAANDALSIGASESMIARGLIPGKTAFTGGIDLSEKALLRIKEGKMEASSASSMLSFAELAIYVFDYLNGIDFVNDAGTEISTKIYTVSKENVDIHIRLSHSYDKIDFKKLSKTYNKSLKKYNFDIEKFNAAIL